MEQNTKEAKDDITSEYTLNIFAELNDNETEAQGGRNNDESLSGVTLRLQANEEALKLIRGVICETGDDDFISTSTDFQNVERYLVKRSLINSRAWTSAWGLFLSKDFINNNGMITLKPFNMDYVENSATKIKNSWRDLIKTLININELTKGKRYEIKIREVRTTEKALN